MGDRVAELAAVAFDLDDTLFDHSGASRRAVGAWLPTLGGQYSPEMVDAWFVAERTHFPAWRDGHVSFAEQRRRRLRDMLDLLGLPSRPDDALDALFADYLDVYRQLWTAFDDVEAAIEVVAAQGLRIGVLTNGPDDLQRAKIAAIGLTDRLGPVLAADVLGVAKPHPGAYAGLCAALDLGPASVLYVGDDHELDVVAARSAGLHAVHLDRRGVGLEPEHTRITSLRELAPHLTLRASTAGTTDRGPSA